MKPTVQTLGMILYSPSQYVIPVFQRHYRWEEGQWAKLWESLEEIRQPEKRGNHFMGFLVFVPGLPQPGEHTRFHLIDGQQRLTTLSLLLIAIRNAATRLKQPELASEIHDYYLTHPLKKGESHYRLLPKERDHDAFIALVNRLQASGRVAEAVQYFETQLEVLKPEHLRPLFELILQRLEFMCATLEAENAYNIFKSLNSTGVPLGASDLIRNFVFMHVPPDDHDAFDAELWSVLEQRFVAESGVLDEGAFSRFFRDFLMSTGRYVPPKDTFAVFEQRYEATGFSPRTLALTLLHAAKQYEVIQSRERHASPEVTEALAELNALESSTTYPLLLALFAEAATGILTDSDLARAIRMLTGFIMRRFISGESSRGYGQMFLRAIPVKEGVGRVGALERFLLDRGWPHRARFAEAFALFPLYQRDYAKHILSRIERSFGHKEPTQLEDAEIEHIMPQTLTAEWRLSLGPDADRVYEQWLHRPGNLTLSGYNRELWNHPFAQKRLRYADSNIRLTKELAQQSDWTEAGIVARGDLLAARAAEIWEGPSEAWTPPQEEPATSGDMDRWELRRRFWSELQDHLAQAYPELPDIEPRESWTVRMPSGVKHIGFEVRMGLRQGAVGVDVWFWRRKSRPLWDQIRAAPDAYNALISAKWGFEPVEGRSRARMYLDYPAKDLRDPGTWSACHIWVGKQLHTLYEQVKPRLAADMAELRRSLPKGVEDADDAEEAESGGI